MNCNKRFSRRDGLKRHEQLHYQRQKLPNKSGILKKRKGRDNYLISKSSNNRITPVNYKNCPLKIPMYTALPQSNNPLNYKINDNNINIIKEYQNYPYPIDNQSYKRQDGFNSNYEQYDKKYSDNIIYNSNYNNLNYDNSNIIYNNNGRNNNNNCNNNYNDRNYEINNYNNLNNKNNDYNDRLNNKYNDSNFYKNENYNDITYYKNDYYDGKNYKNIDNINNNENYFKNYSLSYDFINPSKSINQNTDVIPHIISKDKNNDTDVNINKRDNDNKNTLNYPNHSPSYYKNYNNDDSYYSHTMRTNKIDDYYYKYSLNLNKGNNEYLEGNCQLSKINNANSFNEYKLMDNNDSYDRNQTSNGSINSKSYSYSNYNRENSVNNSEYRKNLKEEKNYFSEYQSKDCDFDTKNCNSSYLTNSLFRCKVKQDNNNENNNYNDNNNYRDYATTVNNYKNVDNINTRSNLTLSTEFNKVCNDSQKYQKSSPTFKYERETPKFDYYKDNMKGEFSPTDKNSNNNDSSSRTLVNSCDKRDELYDSGYNENPVHNQNVLPPLKINSPDYSKHEICDKKDYSNTTYVNEYNDINLYSSDHINKMDSIIEEDTNNNNYITKLEINKKIINKIKKNNNLHNNDNNNNYSDTFRGKLIT